MRRVLTMAAVTATAVASTVLAPGASAAASHEVNAASGAVSAKLSWRGNFQDTKNFRIEISRAGAIVVDEPVEIADCGSGEETTFACPWPVGDKPLEIRDLEGDGEPEIVITAFTGGAHCCVVALIYRWTGTEYVTSQRNFFGAAWRLADLDREGKVEFVTSDYRFDYLYGSHAESVFPIQIFRFQAGKFKDVTADFPAQVTKDATRIGREYGRRAQSRKRIGVRSALAAYIADLYTLDKKRRARRELHKALEAGVLEETRFDPVGPWGRKYIRNLRRTLRRFGY